MALSTVLGMFQDFKPVAIAVSLPEPKQLIVNGLQT